jgi:hypothetical protein
LFSEVVTDEEPSIFDEEPSTFDEAWNHEELKTRGKWRVAIKKELCDMDKQLV